MSLTHCDKEVFDKGHVVSVCNITKQAAEELCRDMNALNIGKYDWHYVAGRVVIKYLPIEVDEDRKGLISDLSRVISNSLEALGEKAKKLPWFSSSIPKK